MQSLKKLKKSDEYKESEEYRAQVLKQIVESAQAIENVESEIPKDLNSVNYYRGGLIPLLSEMKDDEKVTTLVSVYKDQLKNFANRESVDITKIKGPIFATHLYCAQCHQKQFNVWKKSRHAQAWKALEHKNQTFNFECMKCHTAGFQDQRGYGTALQDLQRTVMINGVAKNFDYRGVQCESCHTPRSTHPASRGFQKRVPKTTCLKCHDPANSPNFNFATYWVVGTEPKHGHMPICVMGVK